MQVGVGYYDTPDSKLAGRQAAQIALQKAGRQEPCDMALVFCTARHDQQALRAGVAAAIGPAVPIYGGGAVGVITNETFGYAGDQVGVALIWLDGVGCDVLAQPGLFENEAAAGASLGQALARQGAGPESPVMLFYNAVDRTGGGVHLLMATWFLQGLEKSLGFLPDLVGAGLQGDHVCSPTSLYTGSGLQDDYAFAMAFSDEVQLDTAIMHGCRPASPYYTVTKAEGPVILEINGKPAISFMDELLGSSIAPEEYPFFLLFGINHGEPWAEYDENNYASRLCLDIDKERGGIVMFEPDMVEGTQFQLMFRSLDYDYMKPKIETLFTELEQEGREPVFAMYIDCAGRCAGYGGLEMEDAVVLQQAVGDRVPLLGLYTGVEIASMGGRPRGLDWTGVFCVFSQSKTGQDAVKPKQRTVQAWDSTAPESLAEESPVEALTLLAEQNAAKILALDTQSIAIRYELEQKRRGFSLLAELMNSLRQTQDYETTFRSVAKRINSALNMQKTAVLVPVGGEWYIPAVLQGFTEEEKQRLAGQTFAIRPEMMDPMHPVLVNGGSDAETYCELRKTLGLPYFISAPVIPTSAVDAILITGRMSEQPPFLSRLGPGDVETVQAIGALMGSVLVRQHLDEAEERARIMLDATPLCANFWDKDFNNIDCNLEAVKLFELSNKQEYLDRFEELMPEYQPDGRRSKEAAVECIEKAFRDGRYTFEWMHQKLNGEPVPSEITLVRVRYKEGDVVIGYTRDLRQLKAQMAEIEKTQAELREARDRAEESSRAKSNFLANMSHEIRTPMNAIIGMTEIAKKTQDPERIEHCLGKIEDASAHLLGIINDILDMSKIDAGKFTLAMTDFAMEDMLQKVANVINFKVDEKQQRFNIKVDKDVPVSIISDQQRLTQVITNLLSNATKFTPEEGRITLRVHKEAQQGEEYTLRFEVEDTGIGVIQEQQDRLFHSFEQADGSISRRFGGTGLGLAISKDIVEMMGGRIWVDSQPQKGSNFQFTIRAKKGQKKLRNKLCSPAGKKGVRILVVDDAPEVLEYFQDIATSIGADCRVTQSGPEALRILEGDSHFHVIFVDWKMPEMDGIELTRRIHEKYGEHVVVVMISAVAWSQIEEQAKQAGVERFIAKPLLPSPIVDCINEVLGAVSVAQAEEDVKDCDNDGVFDGRRILLAEDIEINREILSALLADTGIVIDNAENGVEACEKFRAAPGLYDAILMDIHMPQMDGYEATRAIRAMDIPQAGSVPIIAMTANVFREDIENCLAAGMNDHVGKPVDIDELMEKLKRYIPND